jgi:hypothetical protein
VDILLMLALGGLLIAPLAASTPPRLIRGAWFGLPPIVIVGAIGAAFCGAGVYLALTKGQYSGGYTAVSVASLAVMLSAGPLLYLGSRYLRRRQGIDIALAMRELPPE